MIAEEIVKKAMEKANGAQVTMVSAETSAVEFENDRLKSAESSQRTTIELKVIVDGKLGASSTTDPNDVEGVVNRAMEAAEFGIPVHFEIPDAQELDPVKIYDPKLLDLEKPEMIHMGKGMMEMIKAYNPEILGFTEVNRTISQVDYANSKGATYSQEHTSFGIASGGNLIRGTDMLWAWHQVGQKKRELDTEEIAEQAITHFKRAEEIVPIESAAMPVIFTPRGAAALFLSLMFAVDGKNVLLGTSPLKDKLGEKIADERFTVVDDPFVDFGSRTSAVDDEGTIRKVTPLIEKGLLKNFIYDLDTAARVGTQPTGHGSKRTWTNLMVSPGDTAIEDMIAGIELGLMAHSYLGLGQGNPISGDFSVNLFAGYKIENGKLAGRVKDVMLAGNVFEALQGITEISKEREEISGFFEGQVPYIQVKELSVTAK
ncbi:MAG: TldD/PmbA family protein [Chloroflexi bacterium]|nr:TldD/PmbA family protein [Chloroflexota bacterium]